MGRNGVGKTTLMDTIMGQHRIESGTIEFDGEDITKLSVEDRASLGIGYVPQGRQIFPLLTVEENLKSVLEQDVMVLRPCQRLSMTCFQYSTI